MWLLISLAVVSLPILDIASLIVVGGRIGVGPTVAAVILAFLAGGLLVRSQGFTLLQRARATLAAGGFPATEVFDGVCVLAGGGLLMFPGFLSDVLGLLLLTPPVRGVLRRVCGAIARRSPRFRVFAATVAAGRHPPAPGRGPVIEGEYRNLDDAPPRLVPSVAPANDDIDEPRPADGPSRSPWQHP